MPSGKHKSRRLRRVFVRTPGSKTTLHYRKRKPSHSRCGGCGAVLKGVARAMPAKMANLPKTAKRPTRPYGGILCSACTRILMKDKAREGQ